MDTVIYVILGLIGLGLLAKITLRVATPTVKRRDQESSAGRAITRMVEAVGRFDGSDESRSRAYETFIDLAELGPYDISNRQHSIPEIAADFAKSLTLSSGPILVEAAYTVVGAHRIHYPTASRAATAKERHENLSATSLFISLFPDWVKRHQVSAPDVFLEQKHRFALVTWLLLDKCEREGLLPNAEG